MMIDVSYLREHGKVKSLPKEVQENVHGILQILDIEYGAEFTLVLLQLEG